MFLKSNISTTLRSPLLLLLYFSMSSPFLNLLQKAKRCDSLEMINRDVSSRMDAARCWLWWRHPDSHWLSWVEEAGQVVFLFSKLHRLTAQLHPPSIKSTPLRSFLLTIYLSVKCFLANQVQNQRPLPLLCGQTGTCHVAANHLVGPS